MGFTNELMLNGFHAYQNLPMFQPVYGHRDDFNQTDLSYYAPHILQSLFPPRN